MMLLLHSQLINTCSITRIGLSTTFSLRNIVVREKMVCAKIYIPLLPTQKKNIRLNNDAHEASKSWLTHWTPHRIDQIIRFYEPFFCPNVDVQHDDAFNKPKSCQTRHFTNILTIAINTQFECNPIDFYCLVGKREKKGVTMVGWNAIQKKFHRLKKKMREIFSLQFTIDFIWKELNQMEKEIKNIQMEKRNRIYWTNGKNDSGHLFGKKKNIDFQILPENHHSKNVESWKKIANNVKKKNSQWIRYK